MFYRNPLLIAFVLMALATFALLWMQTHAIQVALGAVAIAAGIIMVALGTRPDATIACNACGAGEDWGLGFCQRCGA